MNAGTTRRSCGIDSPAALEETPTSPAATRPRRQGDVMPEPARRRPPDRRRVVAAAALALLFLTSACKDPQQVAAVAETGSQSAAALRDYYKTLSDDVETILELESFLSAVRGVPFDSSSQQLLADEIAALDSRAKAADRLASAYTALGTLAGTDAPEVAATAGQNLATAVAGVTRMPSGVDPAPLFGSVVGDVTAAIESRELGKANRALLSALSAAEQLFSRERDLYEGIVVERANKIEAVGELLLDQGLLDPSPLLQQLATMTGLPLAAGAQPSDALRQALSALALAKTERLGALTAAAAESLEATLLAQIQAQTALGERRAPSLSQVNGALARATTLLDQIAAIKQEEEAAKAAAAAGGNP